MSRTILHMDMDAFFAAVEQADNPALKGKPVIVGGAKRGVVSTASYEARKYGVRSAMPIFEAKRRCPQGIFLPVRMERYQEVSQKMMAVLEAVSPLVEQVSIDEAFVDLTGTERLHGDCIRVARKIKERIWAETSLTCSIGIAPNKFLAKIASDLQKPDGLTIVPEEVQSFLKDLPGGKLPGVGPKSEETLRGLGIRIVSDILSVPPGVLERKFGKYGLRLVELAQGIDDSPVIPSSPAKSMGSEDTLPEDTTDINTLKKQLLSQAEEAGERLRRHGLKGRTITLKLKHSDFTLVTRSHSLKEATCATKILYDTAVMLLERYNLKMSVRLIGLAVSNFGGGQQYSLLPGLEKEMEKLERVDHAIDRIREKLGPGMIKRGLLHQQCK
ncbi:MAG: DNA polymerase IV [Thermodesulfobacteriota bacterium]|nr:DNA polymerase IV [Thermodesulfobacteriota bacterium]